MARISQQGHRGLWRGVALVSLLALTAGCSKELILEGERFSTRTPLSASIPTESNPNPTDPQSSQNEGRPISLPAAQALAEWTHRGGNARHVSGNSSLSGALQLAWAANIGTGDSRRYSITAAPVVGGGRIYTMDAVGRITAVSPSGAVLWQTASRPAAARADISGGGLAYGGGRVVATNGYGDVVALDGATGAIVWRQQLGMPAAAPTIEGERVYAVGRDNTAWAISLTDGRVQWTLPGIANATGMIGAAGPAVTADYALIPFSNGEVVAVDKASGNRIWNTQVQGARLGSAYGMIRDITGDPVVDGGRVYIGNQSGRTIAVDATTGNRLWAASDAAYGPVVPAGGSVFFVNDEAKLLRLDAASGETIWSVDMPYYLKEKPKQQKSITAHYGPILAGGRLLVASGDGQLRFFNPVDGSLIGGLEIPGGAAAAPAIVGGVLYVVTKKGQLLAFR